MLICHDSSHLSHQETNSESHDYRQTCRNYRPHSRFRFFPNCVDGCAARIVNKAEQHRLIPVGSVQPPALDTSHTIGRTPLASVNVSAQPPYLKPSAGSSLEPRGAHLAPIKVIIVMTIFFLMSIVYQSSFIAEYSTLNFISNVGDRAGTTYFDRFEIEIKHSIKKSSA